ncbi:oxidosqualene cyclase [Spathaspora passalidarum NRRL Y-27907]|uniref:Terpene cyclase/mutase family member n=1 Tax=Spathaspora passalidarum (strain NRRL Y-27907 / 11-Y1) TaxID=619300 RepID=G3ALP9_SPAPN|nr:oxidosqualene cyclase [Spathaspora passalidarum NRRL Y-27907]EGW33292.1 oxidosqualene cyclase [Spathaspora passalidarum NRRL Y-27907]
MYYSEEIGLPKTDPTRWRLRSSPLGSETWHYITDDEELAKEPQSTFVQWLLESPDFPAPEPSDIKTPGEAMEKGADFLRLLQLDNGILPCQYKGPMFMTIGYLAANYFSGTPIPDPYRHEMIRYIVNTAHPVDGGWGLHSIDKSTCFGTTMNYVCLRLLGMDPDHIVMQRARRTLHKLGGALGNPHWGKCWLAVLNLYEWDGVNPAPPELWTLPYSLIIHPGRWWVHTRAIYLPLGYVVANRVKCTLDPLLEQIRNEIYLPKQLPYESIKFSKYRNNVCGVDLYYPTTKLLDFANTVLCQWEKLRPNWILNLVNNRVYDLILKEYYNTEYLCIAPVSFAFNMVVTCHREGNESANFKKLTDKMNDVLFHGPQGMTVMGTNGVQVWDVAFMVQYFFVSGLVDNPRYHDMIRKGYMFLVRSQFTEDCVEGSFRDKRKGAWPFSTKEQGYTVSDCTAEAMKAIIMVKNHSAFSDIHDEITDEKLYDAVEVLLNIQNTESYEFGSFSAYEKIRSTLLLEKLNPAQVFNNIMVEYPYVECTDSSVLGLTYFHKYYPNYKSSLIESTIENAINYIKKAQDTDGSWYGSWGICYTYAAMFALEAFNAVGLDYETSRNVQKGCDFLVSKQLSDGGWSESMKACETHTYVNGPKSLVVQTAWAVIGLLLANYPDERPIKKGIKFLMDRQKPTGEWEFEDIEGVFNHSCAIEYPSYRFLFPIKALGLYKKNYGDII